MKQYRTPVISDTQCVHSILTSATCNQCETACPRNAIVLYDDYLGLDDSLCDGCGVCVSACPMSAVELPRGTIVIAESGNTKTAFFACERSRGAPQETLVSCIHAIGLADLSILHKLDVRQIVAEYACTECKVRSKNSLSSTLQQFNRVIESRGCTAITSEFLPSGQWGTRARDALASVGQPENLSRRMLFAKLAPATGESGQLLQLDSAEAAGQPGVIDGTIHTDGTIHPDSAVHAFVPDINSTRCNACNACCHICPTQALTLVNADPTGSRYKIAADACTGCGMCIDVCEIDAVSVHAMQMQMHDEISLLSITCKKCGVQFQHPIASGPADSLCCICRDSRQKAALFQVIE